MFDLENRPKMKLADTSVAEQPEPAAEEDQKKDLPQKSKIERIREWLEENYCFRRNEVTCNLEFKKFDDTDNEWREFQDEDEADILYRLNCMGFSKPENHLQVIMRSNIIKNCNPVKEYFDGLVIKNPATNNIRRLADCIRLTKMDEMVLFVGEKAMNYRELFEYYFEKWLVACYLCNIGVQKNDVMLILIGAQGRFKTSFLNHLCPKSMEKYIVCSTINPSLQDYNTATYLTDKMFINVDDQMENIFGKDYNSMKSIISQDFVSKRVLYSKRAKNRRRIANFVGSVNESHFLRDSNNRRYLCFKIDDIDPHYTEVDMDQVWAEVKMLAKQKGLKYVFGKEDYVVIDQMNENFIAPSEETEALKTVFKKPSDEDKGDIYWLQFSEILQMLRIATKNQGLKSYNLQTAMRKYGYVSQIVRKKARGGTPLHLYPVQMLPPTSAALAEVRDRIFCWRDDENY